MQRFFRELQRRRVTRVAIVYGVVGWAIVQVADVVFPALQVPAWALTLVVLLVLIGFPVALVLAWAFEVTPEGVRRTAPTEGDRAQTGRLPPAFWAGVAAAVVLLAGFGIGRMTFVQGAADAAAAGAAAPGAESESGAADAPSDPAPIRSLAVLPFQNLSADEANEYFSDGITEDILTALAKIGDLHVISRTSSMTYKDSDKPLRMIGEELGVQAILEGSVRRQENQIRIVAQLIDARDDGHLWAETYDRELTDLFAIQSEIAEAIAAALHTELSDVERERILAGGTSDLDAYELYLRGREAQRGPFGAESVETTVAYFREALELDPSYALAHAGLAVAYADRQQWEGVQWGDSAILSASRAIRLDPDAAESYAALGEAQHYWGLFELADRNFELALERNPNLADAVASRASLRLVQGRLDEALGLARRAVTLDPTRPLHYGMMGDLFLLLDDEDTALRWFERRRELAPEDPESHLNFVRLHLERGRIDRAREELERAQRIDPDAGLYDAAMIELVAGRLSLGGSFLERYHQRRSLQWDSQEVLGWVYAELGEWDRARPILRNAEEMALHWIGRGDRGEWTYSVLATVQAAEGRAEEAIGSLHLAYEHGRMDLRWLRTDPTYRDLHGHPRFEALLERIEEDVAAMRATVEAEGDALAAPPG